MAPSASDVFPNTWVRHPRWGVGLVRTVLRSGYECIVEFDRYGPRRVRTDAVAPADPPRGEEVRTGAGVRVRGEQYDAHRSWKGLFEAFRLGIVPQGYVEEWTFGRDREAAILRAWLDDPAAGALLVAGPYGAGKSHMLEYLRARALRRGYAVGTTGFDPTEAAATFPKRAWRALAAAIEVPLDDGIVDLRGAIERAADALGAEGVARWKASHRYLGPVLDAALRGRLTARLWDEFCGLHPRGVYLTLYDHSTAANIYCNILSGLSRLLVEALGVRGLLLSFDEVETAEVRAYAWYWPRSLNFLRALVRIASDDDDLLDEPVVRGVTGYEGTRSHLVYSGHRRDVPYLHGIPSHLKVVLALTPGAMFAQARGWSPDLRALELAPVGDAPLRELFRHLQAAYREEFGVAIDATAREWVFRTACERAGPDATRTIVKGLVEALDIARFHRDEPLETLLARRDDAFL